MEKVCGAFEMLKLVSLTLICGLSLILFGSHVGAQSPQPGLEKIYASFAAAYETYDLELLATLYSQDAITAEMSVAGPTDVKNGRAEVITGFSRLFERNSKAGRKIEILFRVTHRTTKPRVIVDTGIYRFRAIKAGAISQQSFGHYVLVFRKDGERWTIANDISSDAKEADFEEPGGPLFPSGKPLVDSDYYDRLTGRYATSTMCNLSVSRSNYRLYLTDHCTGQRRGLRRIAGRTWESGDTVVPGAEAASARIIFCAEDKGRSLEVQALKPSGPSRLRARRLPEAVTTAPIVFKSFDSTMLAGTVTTPIAPGRKPAVVIVSGPGAQDRHGYGAVNDQIAEQFSARGFVVLTFDRRGVGASQGKWQSQSFASHAEDVLAARKMLIQNKGVFPGRVGLAGLSQAGWISARAIESVPEIPFVFLLSAAGTAMTAEEQDDFYAANALRCSGIPETKIAQVLVQRSLFFRAKSDIRLRSSLKQFTAKLEDDKRIATFLLPNEIAPNPDQWFYALETNFDPRPVWKSYGGEALFVFGEMDNATPALLASRRVSELHNKNLGVIYSQRAQHLGLIASTDAMQTSRTLHSLTATCGRRLTDGLLA